MLIFGLFTGGETRLGAGAFVVLILLLTASMGRHRFILMAASAVVTGHMTSIVLATAALIQAGSMNGSRLHWVAVPLVVLYAILPGLRVNPGFRLSQDTALQVNLCA